MSAPLPWRGGKCAVMATTNMHAPVTPPPPPPPPPPRLIVPSSWLLVLQKQEVAPPLDHTTPRRRPTRVRFPWER